MTANSTLYRLTATLVFLVVSCLQAHSFDLKSGVVFCEANPVCSHIGPDRAGRVLFKLQGPLSFKAILCESDGRCSMALPRGQRLSIKDLVSALSAK